MIRTRVEAAKRKETGKSHLKIQFFSLRENENLKRIHDISPNETKKCQENAFILV